MQRFFGVEAAGSTVNREVVGGLTTFLTMAYIVFVNPAILAAAGVPQQGAFIATCLSAAFATLMMAVLANYPIALAPGMGLNAYFAYGIVLTAGVPWPTALGLVFWAGMVFLVLTFTGARKAIVRAIPTTIKLSGAAGIGLFIAFIGLQQAGLIVKHPATMVAMGKVTEPASLLALGALGLTLVLMARRVPTAIFWGLAFSLVVGILTGVVPKPTGVVAWPTFEVPGLQIDLLGALRLEYLPILFVILFFDVFDTLGTLMGVAHEGGLLVDGELPRIDRAMTADALGSVAGALLGTSTVTSYIESGSGVGVGARTGLSSVVVAALFVVALFLAPLASVVGGENGLNPVTAPALIAVGTLMVRAVREIRWEDATEALPAFFTILLMPLSFNVSHGLAVGIMVYALAKTAAGRWSEVHWIMYLLSFLFVLRYALLPV